ncbi:MAG: DeoR/GlpR transcriptional regulator [Spirochaetaceae bacterium]|nr:MAG: DeoR/GlpR transcriptional regulator [Spirochaetaceae bacterium]
MLERQRREAILRLVDLYEIVSIHDVGEATGASESTLRRDFAALEQERLVRRVRGGVQRDGADRDDSATPSGRAPFDLRATVNTEKKRRIARRACGLLADGDTIFIDGGTTTYQMVEYLAALAITVITNSFAIASALVDGTPTVIIPEGQIDPASRLILTTIEADPFGNYAASKAFMGIEGISAAGLTNSDSRVIQAERSMIRHASQLIVLADGSKFGRRGHLALCPIESVATVITTTDADGEIVGALRDRSVSVLQV